MDIRPVLNQQLRNFRILLGHAKASTGFDPVHGDSNELAGNICPVALAKRDYAQVYTDGRVKLQMYNMRWRWIIKEVI
jgi:hypothetical protein